MAIVLYSGYSVSAVLVGWVGGWLVGVLWVLVGCVACWCFIGTCWVCGWLAGWCFMGAWLVGFRGVVFFSIVCASGINYSLELVRCWCVCCSCGYTHHTFSLHIMYTCI